MEVVTSNTFKTCKDYSPYVRLKALALIALKTPYLGSYMRMVRSCFGHLELLNYSTGSEEHRQSYTFPSKSK